MKNLLAGLLLVALGLVARNAGALDLPGKPTDRVTDLASVLAADEVDAIWNSLITSALADAAMVDLSIVVFPSTDGGDPEAIVNRMAAKWGVCSEEHDRQDDRNQIVLAVFLREGTAAVRVNPRLAAGGLTDGVAAAVVADKLGPGLQAKDLAVRLRAAYKGLVWAAGKAENVREGSTLGVWFCTLGAMNDLPFWLVVLGFLVTTAFGLYLQWSFWQGRHRRLW